MEAFVHLLAPLQNDPGIHFIESILKLLRVIVWKLKQTNETNSWFLPIKPISHVKHNSVL